MKRVLAITLYDRTPEVVRAVCAALRFPGNEIDTVAVCYDRAPKEAVDTLRDECGRLAIELREEFFDDGAIGPRCPSKSWNLALSQVDEPWAFCMSSEMILAPHTIGMAYHLAQEAPGCLIVAKAEHTGQSYAWTQTLPDGTTMPPNRTISSSYAPSPLGFAWMMPMDRFRRIGGFDEIYMKGFCYEDDDFVIRLWEDGADFVFCDDMIGFHLEHKRDHLRDRDGRVSINADIFKERWGTLNYLKDRKLGIVPAMCEVGLGFWLHQKNDRLTGSIFAQQKLYGQEAPWRAIPANIVEA